MSKFEQQTGINVNSSSEDITDKKSKNPYLGGSKADVIVQFRPHPKHMDDFGFDWLRLGDATAHYKHSQCDTSYRENVGYHLRNGKKVKQTLEESLYPGTFAPNKSLQNKLSAVYGDLPKATLNAKTYMDDFVYKVPVMTLMPKSKKHNPHNVNLIARLDTLVNLGANSPKVLRLGFAKKDEKTITHALAFSTMYLPTKSTQMGLQIKSVGVLRKDVTLYVYADDCHEPCGALKILRNDKVKHINFAFMAVITTETEKIDLQKFATTAKVDDISAVRKMMAQALISIDQVYQGDQMIVDVSSAFSLHPQKYLDPKDSSKLSYAAFNVTVKLLAQTIAKNPTLHALTKRKKTFKFYFFSNGCINKKGNLAGVASIGRRRTIFYDTIAKDVTAFTLAHELGHNLGLWHPFQYTPQVHKPTYTYAYQSTDNVMDYSHVLHANPQKFYAWQWPFMNKGIKL